MLEPLLQRFALAELENVLLSSKEEEELVVVESSEVNANGAAVISTSKATSSSSSKRSREILTANVLITKVSPSNLDSLVLLDAAVTTALSSVPK